MKTQIISENTIMVYFTNTIDTETSEKVTQALYVLQSSLGNVILDAIPSYHSILITVDILQTNMNDFQQQVEALLNQPLSASMSLPHLDIELPVYYGEEVALDAAEVCAHSGLSWSDVTEIHSQANYRVYAIGFAPGFAYLGNLDRRLQIPRKALHGHEYPKVVWQSQGSKRPSIPKHHPVVGILLAAPQSRWWILNEITCHFSILAHKFVLKLSHVSSLSIWAESLIPLGCLIRIRGRNHDIKST